MQTLAKPIVVVVSRETERDRERERERERDRKIHPLNVEGGKLEYTYVCTYLKQPFPTE